MALLATLAIALGNVTVSLNLDLVGILTAIVNLLASLLGILQIRVC